MNPRPFQLPLFALLGIYLVSTGTNLKAQDASQLASDLAGSIEDGTSLTKVRMNIKSGGSKTSLNLQIKARRTAQRSEVLYQVIFPADRKGESILLRQDGTSAAKGYSYTRNSTNAVPLGASNMTGSAFGSDLTYQDLIENFFRWKNHTITGKETIRRNDCLILESTPGSSDSTPYGKVRSWVDTKRMVVMKVEKYDRSGNLATLIETQQVHRDDKGRSIPANLLVRRTGSGTETDLDGSNIRHDVSLSDEDFRPENMTNLR